MRWLISTFVLGLGLVVGPTVATADIVRSCSGAIDIVGSGVVIAKVNGEGTCARKAKANQCRERARQAIVGCANALWAGRNKDKIPDACSGGRAGRAVLQWQQVILIPHGNSLRDRVRWNRCCKEQKGKGRASISISVSGDKGCGLQQAISFGDIDFDCARDRGNLCPPKPGTRAGG